MAGERVLVAYASRAGSTAEVAGVVGTELAQVGFDVDVKRVQDVRDLSGYRAAVVGSAVRVGKLLPETMKFARRHRQALENIPVAWFVVCLTMKDEGEEPLTTTKGYVTPLEEIRKPVSTGLFAGAVRDLKRLGPVIRFMFSKMKIAEQDHRNMDLVREWAREVGRLLKVEASQQ